MSSNRINELSEDNLNFFLSNIKGLDKEEIKKSKALYVKNLILKYKQQVKQHKAFKIALIFFYIIPLFIPFIIYVFISFKNDEELLREKIKNAIEIWKDDLKEYHFDTDFLDY